MSLIVNYSDKEQYEPLPAGKYIARLDWIIVKPDMKFGDGLQWTFIVCDNRPEKQQHKGKTVRGLTGQSASPKAKITAWLSALGIFMDEDTKQFDIHTLYGSYVVVNVVENPGEDKQGNPVVYANVDAVISVPKQLETYIDTTVPVYIPKQQGSSQRPPQQRPPVQQRQAPVSPATRPVNSPVVKPQAQQPDPSELISDEDISF